MTKVETTTYLVLEPQHDYAGRTNGLRADRIVAKPPRLNSRSIAVKLNISIDQTVFQQFLPEVTVEIGNRGDLLVPTVTVEPPSEDDVDEAEAEPDA